MFNYLLKLGLRKSFLAKNIGISSSKRGIVKLELSYFGSEEKKGLTRIYDPQIDYYHVLKVKPAASPEEIKEAFHRLS